MENSKSSTDLQIFISGASGGIGLSLIEKFASEPSHILHLQCQSGKSRIEQFLKDKSYKERCYLYECDLRNPEEVQSMFKRIQENGKNMRLDVSVVNHGIWPTQDQLIHELSQERITNTISVNLLGSIWICQEFFSQLQQFGARQDGVGASICFIGSTAGIFGEAYHSDYSCSKAALFGLVKTLQNEIVKIDPYGRVNMVDPGWVVTPMSEQVLQIDGVIQKVCQTMPLRQIATPKDVAESTYFLSSHKSAKHISGQTITLAGGMQGRVLWNKDEIDEATVRQRIKMNQSE